MEEGNVPGLEGHDTESLQLTLRLRGLKTKHTGFLINSAFTTLGLFRALCNFAEGPELRNFGPLNEGGLGPLSSDHGFDQSHPNDAQLVHILRVRIIGSVHLVCQTNWWPLGRYRPACSYMRR